MQEAWKYRGIAASDVAWEEQKEEVEEGLVAVARGAEVKHVLIARMLLLLLLLLDLLAMRELALGTEAHVRATDENMSAVSGGGEK